MKNQATNQTELQAQFFAMPNKAVVTEIVFTNGETAKQITAFPKWVLVDHVVLGVIHTLSMQPNILSCKNELYSNIDGKLEMTISFGTHFFTIENKIPSPVKSEYLFSNQFATYFN